MIQRENGRLVLKRSLKKQFQPLYRIPVVCSTIESMMRKRKGQKRANERTNERKEKKRKERTKQAALPRNGSVNESVSVLFRLASGRRGGKSGGHGVPRGGRYAEPRARFKRFTGLGPGSPRCRPCCRWFLDHGGILDQRTGRVRSRQPTTGTPILPSRTERTLPRLLSLSLSLSLTLYLSTLGVSFYSTCVFSHSLVHSVKGFSSTYQCFRTEAWLGCF